MRHLARPEPPLYGPLTHPPTFVGGRSCAPSRPCPALPVLPRRNALCLCRSPLSLSDTLRFISAPVLLLVLVVQSAAPQLLPLVCYIPPPSSPGSTPELSLLSITAYHLTPYTLRARACARTRTFLPSPLFRHPSHVHPDPSHLPHLPLPHLPRLLCPWHASLAFGPSPIP